MTLNEGVVKHMARFVRGVATTAAFVATTAACVASGRVAADYNDADAQYRHASDEYASGEYAAALKSLEAAFTALDELTDDSSSSRADALELRNACDDLRAKIASTAPELVAEQDYRAAVAAFANGDERLASRRLDSALRAAPNDEKYKALRRKLDNLEANRRAANASYQSALQFMTAKNFKAAYRAARQAHATAPDVAEYKELFARATNAYRDELRDAATAAVREFQANQGTASYKVATKALKDARTIFPKDQELNDLETQTREFFQNRKWRVETIAGVSVVFRRIMPGEFVMGSPEGEVNRDANETRRRVTIEKEFWMAETETTQALWRAVMGENPSSFKLDFRAGGGELPVESVSWLDCKKFVRKLNNAGYVANVTFALPTEEQWEYACRAGTTTAFSFGTTLYGDKANCNGEVGHGLTRKGRRENMTVKARSYEPNPWGLYDMHGNVWEWCDSEYVLAGATTRDLRVIRGGSWFDASSACRSAKRKGNGVEHKSDMIGFRLIMTE